MGGGIKISFEVRCMWVVFFWRLVEELKVVALRGGFEKHAYLRLRVSMLNHGLTFLNSY